MDEWARALLLRIIDQQVKSACLLLDLIPDRDDELNDIGAELVRQRNRLKEIVPPDVPDYGADMDGSR